MFRQIFTFVVKFFITNEILIVDHGKNNKRQQDSVYSNKVRAGKRRTYFFDVRETKGKDYYVTLTESTKRFNDDGFERHKIFLYKEDFNRFVDGLQDVIDHIKNELMPDYDYDEFTRRHQEYEAKRLAEAEAEAEQEEGQEEAPTTPEPEGKLESEPEGESEPESEEEEESKSIDSEDDMAW